MNELPTAPLVAVAEAATKAAEWVVRRNETIVAAVRAGHSHREVARTAGLSHTGVARIVERAAKPGGTLTGSDPPKGTAPAMPWITQG